MNYFVDWISRERIGNPENGYAIYWNPEAQSLRIQRGGVVIGVQIDDCVMSSLDVGGASVEEVEMIIGLCAMLWGFSSTRHYVHPETMFALEPSPEPTLCFGAGISRTATDVRKIILTWERYSTFDKSWFKVSIDGKQMMFTPPRLRTEERPGRLPTTFIDADFPGERVLTFEEFTGKRARMYATLIAAHCGMSCLLVADINKKLEFELSIR